MRKSSQEDVARVRPGYVSIVQPDNPLDAQARRTIPFRNGVFADLSGNASPKEKPHMEDRKFVDVDIENFNKFMKSVEAASAFNVESTLSEGETLHVNLSFESMASFSPVEVAKQVPALNRLLRIRQHLETLRTYMDGKREAQTEVAKLISNPQLMLAFSQSSGAHKKATKDESE